MGDAPLLAFFEGKFVPLPDAKVGIDTQAFNYGTGVFEGIRAYWNEKQQQLYLLKLREHYDRMARSSHIFRIGLKYDVDEMCRITADLMKRNEFRADVYVRPLLYKSAPLIKLQLSDVPSDFAVFARPMGGYLDLSKGLHLGVSSWRRLDDNALPARGKNTGSYINAALASDDARLNGYDEAVMLTQQGKVAEAASSNLFAVINGRLVTPSATEDILEGITRSAIAELANNEFGISLVERAIDRSELYTASEIFLCGTGVQVAAAVSLDRRQIGDGRPGPLTTRIQEVYFQAVRGELPRYAHWLTPVYG
jgi:branched-chain amino acid aminotransferase